MPFSTALPEGRAGQILALALLAAVIAVLSIGLCLPALDWYQARNEALADDAAKIAHLDAMRLQLPALRAAAAAAPAPADAGLLTGATDDLAGANLQGAVQDLAHASGLAIDSAEALPAVTAGPLRRIGLSVSLNATWPAFISLLAAMAAARPGMEVDNITVAAAAAPDTQQDAPLNITFAVYGFRP